MVKESEEDKKKKAKPKAKPKEEKKEEPKAEAHKEAVKHEAHVPKPEAPKAEAAPVEKAEIAKPKKRKAASKKAETKVFVARGKRKESVARATITAGKGVVRINSQKLESLNNPYIRDIIREPLRYIGPEANTVDISVNVNGGGSMGQAQAARTAIANALWMYFDQMNLRKKFVEIDRSLVIEDTRRVETKKFRGPKARARFQKSYR
ncbi:MAG: 30S ribosomal protein S9 [Candidatus Omnitrophota bacterium]